VAQEQLGAAYHFGQLGVKVDHALARHWLQRAVDSGRPYAARLLAGLLRDGQGGSADVARADALVHLAAMKGDARSQAEIGYLHYTRDTPAERAEGLKWITAAARQADTYALSLLAYHHRYSPERAYRRLDRVIDLSVRGAQLGDRAALGRAAEWYYHEGTLELRQVLDLLEEAAGKGHGPSAYLLGYHYWEGRRANRNGQLAVKWLKLAAQNGYQEAELVLAHCHATGFGTRKDPAHAERLYAAAARLEAHLLNDFAWQLAVSPHDDVRDGARAVQIMEGVLREAENVSATRVDTLAAAYAETGRFEDAVKTQRRAISLLPRGPWPEGVPEAVARVRRDLESRLALYVAGKPYRRET
jgi:TPR repeat protein